MNMEEHRRDLTGHCYRMLGSAFDADDAVQETMVRAWKSQDRFEGRAALRTWLHRIATNVCLDMLESRSRRVRAMDLGPAGSPDGPIPDVLPHSTWLLPMPDDRMLSPDPAEMLAGRETIRLAFMAALQSLPPRQRAVLILREVLSFQATEVASLLDMSVPAVNSALQRARDTLAAREPSPDVHEPMNARQQELLARYVDAFVKVDHDTLVSLLHQDATWSMPPYPLWLRGPSSVHRWLEKVGEGCRDSRMVPLVANGSPAFAQYRLGAEGVFEPWAIMLVDVRGDLISGVCSFLYEPRLFTLFGMPVLPDP